MVGNAVTTRIITGGLSCDPAGTACTNGIITTFFDLYCTTEIPPVIGGGGGGPYPRDAWNKFGPGDIQNFYKPVPNDQQYYVVPRDQEARYFLRYKIVKMHLRVGQYEFEKEYSVPENKIKRVIKVMNLANVTQERLSVTVESVRKIATDAAVTIKNLRLKKGKG